MTLTIGIDLGDRKSHVCVLDAAGEVVEQGRRVDAEGVAGAFRGLDSHAYRARSRRALVLGVRASKGAGSRSDRGQRAQCGKIFQSDSKNDRLSSSKTETHGDAS